jgi:Fur family ferric uptake transcriptional regulator
MGKAKRATDDAFARFRSYLREQRLKSTAQRDAIVEVFLDGVGHVSVEELYGRVRQRNPGIGYATVYRTMKLLTECGVADERHFRNGEARYEIAEKDHHDHLICERCGKIVEFNSEELERQQERIARFLGFVVSRHRMELYGICTDCRTGRPGKPRPKGVQQV